MWEQLVVSEIGIQGFRSSSETVFGNIRKLMLQNFQLMEQTPPWVGRVMGAGVILCIISILFILFIWFKLFICFVLFTISIGDIIYMICYSYCIICISYIIYNICIISINYII